MKARHFLSDYAYVRSDMLDPEPSKFGMPWYVILCILCFSVLVFLLLAGKIIGLLLAPWALVAGAARQMGSDLF